MNHYNMKWGIEISQIIPFLIGSHMHEAKFHKIYSKKSSLQKVNDGWEICIRFCPSFTFWTVGHLGVKNAHDIIFWFDASIWMMGQTWN